MPDTMAPVITHKLPESTPRQRWVALVMLTLVCVFWGLTFPLMEDAFAAIGKHVSDEDQGAVPALFLALRFSICALLMPLYLLRRGGPPRMTAGVLKYGFLLAFFFVGSFYLQVYGLDDDDVAPSVSAFVTSLFAVLTPFVVWVWFRQKPSPIVALAIPLALAGVVIISWTKGMTLESLHFSTGLLLTGLCAAGFAVHIVVTDYTTRRADPALLSVIMMVFAAITAVAVVPFIMNGVTAAKAVPAIMTDVDVLTPLLITTIFATVVAVYVWNRWQRVVGPVRAALLYMLEPVFAAIFSVGCGGEELRWTLYTGGALILGANLLCEVVPVVLARRRKAGRSNA